MKVTFNRSTKSKVVYPYIGIHVSSDMVVLFTSSGSGIVLNEGSLGYPIGGIHLFDEDGFKPLEGTITLSN